MPDRRGRKTSSDDLIPEDRLTWARLIWAEEEDVARSEAGAWMLREAAKALGLPEEAVDEALRKGRLIRKASARYGFCKSVQSYFS